MEAALFAAYWDDGLLDLLVGGALLAAGVGWLIGGTPMALVSAPFWVVLWVPLRRRLVEPYAGYVRYCRERQRRNAHGLLATAALGAGLGAALLVGVLFAGPTGTVPATWVAGLPAGIVAFGLVLAALLTGSVRFHGYAGLMLAAAVVAVWWCVEPGAALAAGALPLLVNGGLRYTHFRRESRAYTEPTP